MDRMLVRQRQAHNARDFRPKFIIAFLGESGNLCERRGGTATFAGWGGNDGTTTFATGATSKQPSEAPSVCCQISDKPCPPSHLRLRARRMPIVCLRARRPLFVRRFGILRQRPLNWFPRKRAISHGRVVDERGHNHRRLL